MGGNALISALVGRDFALDRTTLVSPVNGEITVQLANRQAHGEPILNAIESADLFEVGIVVVRWYGGIKLGTGGLSRAYRDTAVQALHLATAVDRYLYVRFEVTVPFVDNPARGLLAHGVGTVAELSNRLGQAYVVRVRKDLPAQVAEQCRALSR